MGRWCEQSLHELTYELLSCGTHRLHNHGTTFCLAQTCPDLSSNVGRGFHEGSKHQATHLKKVLRSSAAQWCP